MLTEKKVFSFLKQQNTLNISYTYGIRKLRWIHQGLEQMEHWEVIRKEKQLHGHTDRWRSSLRLLGFVL